MNKMDTAPLDGTPVLIWGCYPRYIGPPEYRHGHTPPVVVHARYVDGHWEEWHGGPEFRTTSVVVPIGWWPVDSLPDLLFNSTTLSDTDWPMSKDGSTPF